MVLAELQLLLGQDHPVGDHSADLALLDRHAPGEHTAGEDDADGGPGLEVPGAADDLAWLLLADVDAAEPHPVGVGMRADLEDATNREVAEVRAVVRDTAVDDPLDLAGRGEEACRQLVQGRLDRDVVAEPGEGYAHQNCEITRRSESQSSRTSGTP